jgi:serine O-acetyltransferase
MRKLIYFFGQIFFLPHALLFLFSKNKNIIAYDLYARKEYKASPITQLYDLTLELLISKYFRTLFYFRTNGFVSNLLRLFYPKERSFHIDINTRIGKGLQLAHPYSTILNAESIGENVYVNHLVTIGEKNGNRPTIGNNVQLHAGCMVIGNIKIGDNAIIGAGAVVVKDIPKDAVAVGNPARILENKIYK